MELDSSSLLTKVIIPIKTIKTSFYQCEIEWVIRTTKIRLIHNLIHGQRIIEIDNNIVYTSSYFFIDKDSVHSILDGEYFIAITFTKSIDYQLFTRQ